jgi:hypothetical protein
MLGGYLMRLHHAVALQEVIDISHVTFSAFAKNHKTLFED